MALVYASRQRSPIKHVTMVSIARLLRAVILQDTVLQPPIWIADQAESLVSNWSVKRLSMDLFALLRISRMVQGVALEVHAMKTDNVFQESATKHMFTVQQISPALATSVTKALVVNPFITLEHHVG
jgi:hypothetical protein